MITRSAFTAGFIASMCIGAIADIFTEHPHEHIFTAHPWIAWPSLIVGIGIACFLVVRNYLLEKVLINNIAEFYKKIKKTQQYSATIKGTREERN